MAKGSSDMPKLLMPIITAVVAVLVAAVAYFFLFAPKIAAFGQGGKYDLTDVKEKIGDDRAYLTRIEQTVDDYRILNSQLRQKVQAAVPFVVDEPGIMATVDAIARTHSMVLTSIDVAPIEDEIGTAGQATARVAVNLEGGDYGEFKLLLADIERSERLFDVRSIVFTPSTAKYSLQLKAYYLPQDVAAETSSQTAL